MPVVYLIYDAKTVLTGKLPIVRNQDCNLSYT